MLLEQARFPEQVNAEKGYRIAQIDLELFGLILATIHEKAMRDLSEFRGILRPMKSCRCFPGYSRGISTPRSGFARIRQR